MGPTDLPAPIVCPVFVVWRTVEGKRKGRVVIDLRPLNSNVMPDAYPLPDEADILSDMKGKKFFTMFDAAVQRLNKLEMRRGLHDKSIDELKAASKARDEAALAMATIRPSIFGKPLGSTDVVAGAQKPAQEKTSFEKDMERLERQVTPAKEKAAATPTKKSTRATRGHSQAVET